jgi:lysozyme
MSSDPTTGPEPVDPVARSMLQTFEGLRLTAYRCEAGRLTIGYGHTDDVFPGMVIPKERAEELLDQDMRRTQGRIRSLVTVPLHPSQLSALICLVFNIGGGQFARSHLLKKLNEGDYIGASSEFKRWIYVKGEPSVNQIRRRKAERELFDSAQPRPV